MTKNIKILLAILIVSAAIVVVGGFQFFKKSISQKNNGNRITEVNEINPRLVDTDNDGLSDHEETVFGTITINPDTDGDGFLDGEEVVSGCSPVIPSPGDCGVIKVNKQQSLTEQLADLVLGGFLSGELDSSNPDFANYTNFLEENSLILGRQYLVVDASDAVVKLESDSSANKQAYINQIAEFVESYVLSASMISNNKFSIKDDQLFAPDFSKDIKDLEILYAKIANLTVPRSWQDIHLRVLDFIIKSKTYEENLQDFSEDPIKALLTLRFYSDLSVEYRDLVSDVTARIRQQNLALPSNNILGLLAGEVQ